MLESVFRGAFCHQLATLANIVPPFHTSFNFTITLDQVCRLFFKYLIEWFSTTKKKPLTSKITIIQRFSCAFKRMLTKPSFDFWFISELFCTIPVMLYCTTVVWYLRPNRDVKPIMKAFVKMPMKLRNSKIVNHIPVEKKLMPAVKLPKKDGCKAICYKQTCYIAVHILFLWSKKRKRSALRNSLIVRNCTSNIKRI